MCSFKYNTVDSNDGGSISLVVGGDVLRETITTRGLSPYNGYIYMVTRCFVAASLISDDIAFPLSSCPALPPLLLLPSVRSGRSWSKHSGRRPADRVPDEFYRDGSTKVRRRAAKKTKNKIKRRRPSR